ncbi:hypothetical protein ILUMI_18690, partial [Ignelater luminosus]
MGHIKQYTKSTFPSRKRSRRMAQLNRKLKNKPETGEPIANPEVKTVLHSATDELSNLPSSSTFVHSRLTECNVDNMDWVFHSKRNDVGSKCAIYGMRDFFKIIDNTLWQQIQDNGQKKTELARLRGDIDSSGMPTITATADGACSKRSYNVNYNALSGV